MGNGKWKMENGKWKMENGKWKMENGKWKYATNCSELSIFVMNMNKKKIFTGTPARRFWWMLCPFLYYSPLTSQCQLLVRANDVPVFTDGQPLANPWAGGLNSCQFSRIDLNNDGQEDLFVFDRIGNRISTFLNTAENEGEIAFTYTRDYNNAFPPLKNWAFLRDYNCDGKKDIFTNSQSGLKIWKNISTLEGGLAFEIVSTGHPANLVLSEYDLGSQPFMAPLYCISPDLPSFVDYDGDGDTDIFSYTESTTTLYYYKSMQIENGNCDQVSYVCANRCYGMFGESPESFDIYMGDEFHCDFNVANPRSEDEEQLRHAGGTLLSLDLDQNGVLDIVCGDVTEQYLISLRMVDVENGIDSAVAITYDFPATFGGSDPVDLLLFPGAFYEDMDNDGVKDLVVSPNAYAQVEDRESVWFYKNNGQNDLPDFDFVQKDFLQDQMIDLGLNAYPVIFDLDNDGLKDMIVANREAFKEGVSYTSRLWYFKNTGTVNAPAFTLIDDNWLDIPSMQWKSVYPAFGDLDGDGDDDLLLGDLDGILHHYKNIAGTGQPAEFMFQPEALADNTNTAIDVGQFATPQILDLNNDGLNDLIVGEKNGNINYYENTGTASSPVFLFIEDTIGDIVSTNYLGIFGYSVPHFFKDENGLWNLLTGSETGQINHFDQIEGNVLGDFHLVTNDYAGINEGDRCAVFLADMNNDGVKDLFYGQIGGGIGYYQSGGTIGEEKIFQDNAIVLYPNPAGQTLNLEININYAGPITFFVLDVTGKTLLQSSVNGKRKEIDVSHFPAGLYFLRVITDRASDTRRFVVR